MSDSEFTLELKGVRDSDPGRIEFVESRFTIEIGDGSCEIETIQGAHEIINALSVWIHNRYVADRIEKENQK